jgi:transcriptional regulator of aromatic amino acid metabolism
VVGSMADWSWYDLIQSIVFARMKNDVSKACSLSDDKFSTVSASNSTPKFPFVYMQIIDSSETSEDLERCTINGARFVFQVSVMSNNSQEESKKIMRHVVKAMKKMLFKATAMPGYEVSSGIYQSNATFTRYIDCGDKI